MGWGSPTWDEILVQVSKLYMPYICYISSANLHPPPPIGLQHRLTGPKHTPIRGSKPSEDGNHKKWGGLRVDYRLLELSSRHITHVAARSWFGASAGQNAPFLGHGGIFTVWCRHVTELQGEITFLA